VLDNKTTVGVGWNKIFVKGCKCKMYKLYKEEMRDGSGKIQKIPLFTSLSVLLLNPQNLDDFHVRINMVSERDGSCVFSSQI
jgi:hypothetical protein